MAQTNKQKQDKRKERLQAAAERDGFETWSQALTAWWKCEARLTLCAVDTATPSDNATVLHNKKRGKRKGAA